MGSRPDLVIFAERVRTVSAAPPEGPHAIVVDGGRVQGIVASADAPHDAREVVRLPEGAVAMPGLVDAHSHPITGLGVTRGMDLSTVRDAAELRRRVAAAAATDEWVLGWGLDLSIVGSPAELAALEEITGTRPMLLRSFDIHAAFANAPALRRAGIDRA